METEIKCRVEKGNLLLENNLEDVNIQIFSNDGTLYKQFVAERGSQPVPLPEKGTFLVVGQTVNRNFVRIIKVE